jgi:glyoxylate/hydroxypyruvate reductase A
VEVDQLVSIVLIGDLSPRQYEVWREALRTHLPRGETLVLAPEVGDKSTVEIALAANPPRGELAKYPHLRFIQSLWAGVDRLLSDPTLPESIPVARLIDPEMAQSMLETVVATTLFVHRQFPAYLHQQARALWRELPQPTATRCKVGILGYGQMGRPAASALAALGFQVSAWGQHARSDATVDYSWGAAGLERTVTDTQILINLLPLTQTTTGILDARLFAKLRAGAAVINLGRGGHLNEEDLLGCLQARQIGHAVLDVFQQEPLATEHPFWSHPRITVLPHVAASTDPQSAAPLALANVAAFRAGRPLNGVVSRERGY